MKLTGVFSLLGIKKPAEAIYLLLLKRGPLSVTEVARSLKTFRPKIYNALADLLDHKIVTKLHRGKRFVYQAESPKVLERLLNRSYDEEKLNISEYEDIFESTFKKAKITSFEGKSGVEELYKQFIASVPKHGVIFRYESPKDYTQNKKYYPSLYFKRANRFGDIDKYVITNEKAHRLRRGSLNRLSKPVPLSLGSFDYNVTQLISGNKVAFIDYTTKSALLIESERFAMFQQKLFQLLFEKL